MLRSPMEDLADQPWRTATAVVSLAVAMWMGAALLTLAWEVEEKAHGWWEQFVPVVYVDSGVDAEGLEAMVDEIEGWSRIAEVTIESQEAFLERLREAPEWDETMGLEASMMPQGLVVKPSPWFVGEAEALAKIEALEVRDKVLMVDVPGAESLAWMEPARRMAWGLAFLVLLALMTAFAGIVAYLRELQRKGAKESYLLERFGMEGGRLRRPTWWRGLAIGASAGVLAAAAVLVWMVGLGQWSNALWGGSAVSAMDALRMSVAVGVLGAVLGFVAGWLGGYSHGAEGLGDGERTRLMWEVER